MMVMTNALACLPVNVCHVEDGKQWCQPDWTAAVNCPANIPQQEWICRREDGTQYSIVKPVIDLGRETK